MGVSGALYGVGKAAEGGGEGGVGAIPGPGPPAGGVRVADQQGARRVYFVGCAIHTEFSKGRDGAAGEADVGIRAEQDVAHGAGEDVGQPAGFAALPFGDAAVLDGFHEGTASAQSMNVTCQLRPASSRRRGPGRSSVRTVGSVVPISVRPASTVNSGGAVKEAVSSMKCRRPKCFSLRSR